MIIPDDLANPIGKWSEYRTETECKCYGKVASYEMAAAFLDVKGWVVEDWGCGRAFAKQYFKQARYVGVDGSESRFCDVVDDLRTRNSVVDGILLRHVLEHNLMWQWILQGAIRCCPKRLCVVFFQAFQPKPCIARDPHPGVVTINMVEKDVDAILSGWKVKKRDASQPGYYEQVWFCES